MSITAQRKADLDERCREFRRDVLTMLHRVQTGHPGGSLSVCEILVSIYFEKGNIRGDAPQMPDRDKVVLCKGHAAPMLYRILAEKGFFPKEDLENLRQMGSHLQGHPCSRHTPGVEISTGPLGLGYPAALGLALADRLDQKENWVYAILGDGEINEGVVWETCMNAVKNHADHLITILDYNGVQLDGPTKTIMPMGNVAEKFNAFGYHVIELDGHDIAQLCDAVDEAKSVKGSPTILLAHTVKGKGVSFMEGKNIWHGKAIDDTEYAKAMDELGGMR